MGAKDYPERRSFFETIWGFYPRRSLKRILKKRNIPPTEETNTEHGLLKELEGDIGHKLRESDQVTINHNEDVQVFEKLEKT